MMNNVGDDPFRAADLIIQEAEEKGASIRFFDVHAEATSEKQAMGYYLDGRASVVAGTHTHVQTADEKILPHGTAFISDLGMTGPEHSIIGMNIEASLAKFISNIPRRFEVADGICCINGIVVDIERETGKANSIERISIHGVDASSDD
jgi:metallophosphoesterase (TIGR00282 family)